jgi:hypothetical protein
MGRSERQSDIESLTSFAVAFRYDDLPFSNCFDRAEGLRRIVLIREWVTGRLNSNH